MTPAGRGMVGLLALMLLAGLALLVMRMTGHVGGSGAAGDRNEPAAGVPRSPRGRAGGIATRAPLGVPSLGREGESGASGAPAALAGAPGMRPVDASDPLAGVPRDRRAEEELSREIGKKTPEEIQSTLSSLASKYPSIKDLKVACTNRPCQATLRATSQEEAQSFVRDVYTTYQGQAGIRFHKVKDPTSGEKFLRGDMTIGTERRMPFRPVPRLHEE